MRTTRTLKLELLRHGPAHNQLLSPLTPYLALCGNHGAGTVHLPLEHREFLLRMRPMHYLPGKAEAEVRSAHLREMGKLLADLLAKVPGLGTDLGAGARGREDLVHLQLVTSAAELALLPFEAALAPQGLPGAGAPLALQTEVPLSITRQVRRASSASLQWPLKPRVLVAIASPPGSPEVPALAHVMALREAIQPWLRPVGATGDNTGELLTVLTGASLASLRDTCTRQRYTHVHILAHGKAKQEAGGERFGLAFHHDTVPDQEEFVTGEELASALRGRQAEKGWLSNPTVVTIASCDSGNVGNVVVPGGSLAHALHEDGVPFVVASQFPLTYLGSVVLTRVLYTQLLWGLDPRVILHDVRQRLRLLGESILDWASVVAYAAFPPNFDAQLAEVQFERAKQAANAALARTDRVVTPDLLPEASPAPRPSLERQVALDQRQQELCAAKDRLLQASPQGEDAGARTTRGLIQGLCGSIDKRLAFNRHLRMQASEEGSAEWAKARRNLERFLERAREHYRQGFSLDPRMYWLATQYVSLSVILKKRLPRDWQAAARLACRLALDLESKDERAWAHASLAELDLLKLYQRPPRGDAPERPLEQEPLLRRAAAHIRAMSRLEGPRSFHVYSTRQQFRRYAEWWFADVPRGKALALALLKAFPEEQEPLPDESLVDESYVR
jgi:hypothetical protein